jgi:hypothetical protein
VTLPKVQVAPKRRLGRFKGVAGTAKISYEKASALPYEELNKLVYPTATSQNVKKEPDFSTVYDELQRHPKLNLRFLWDEYKLHNPEGLEYCHRRDIIEA